ncbi:hypothetical protein D3C81_678270 [compost metagenome]
MLLRVPKGQSQEQKLCQEGEKSPGRQQTSPPGLYIQQEWQKYDQTDTHHQIEGTANGRNMPQLTLWIWSSIQHSFLSPLFYHLFKPKDLYFQKQEAKMESLLYIIAKRFYSKIMES